MKPAQDGKHGLSRMAGTVFVGLMLVTANEAKGAEKMTTADFYVAVSGKDTNPGTAKPPFSFVYDGKASAALLAEWSKKVDEKKLDDNRTERTLTYTDKKTGLDLRCQVIEYSDYPAVEWVVYFKNGGATDSPIIENVQALDVSLTREGEGEFVLHHAKGSDSRMDDFQPVDDPLPPGSSRRIHSFGVQGWGMSSVESLPFFNVEENRKGMIAAIGWSGAWSATFVRDGLKGLQIRSGMVTSKNMDTTHLLLHPGEEIRTPRMLILFWEGDRMRAHNRWRRLLLEHYTPRPGGAILKVPLCDANWGEMTADEQIAKIKWWKQHDLPMECYWIDAGWNGAKGEDCFTAANNRVSRKDLYPLGMKPVSDAAHQAGLKFLLWTWPHTARAGVEIGAKHPEWVLPGGGLDHGNPDVNRWMIDYYCGTVDEHGIDVFRQDGHSIYPADTAPDRLGMAQIRYTVGFYEFWEALLKSHPNVIIDNCAGGGRKIDLETIRRSVPLWRSDYQSGPTGLVDFDPNGIQAQTWALSYWVPLSSGACTTRSTVERVYAFRSAYSPGLTLAWHLYAREINSGEYDFELCRKLLKEYLSVRQYFYGDYYPLTPYSLEATVWMAWQFQRPGQTDGVLQAFRREKAADQEMRLRLKDLDSDAIYELKDLDKTGTERFSGRELMETGLLVKLPPCGSAVILYYQGTYTASLTVRNEQGRSALGEVTTTVSADDAVAPALVDVGVPGLSDRVLLTFSEPVQQADAAMIANYAIMPGVQVLAASPGPDRKTVTLTTSPLSPGGEYTITAKNIRDCARKPNKIVADARQTFRCPSPWLARWKLDEGKGLVATDDSGHKLDGALKGGPTWTNHAGRAALSFDGLDDLVEIPTRLQSLSVPFSIAFWVNPAATQVEYADILGNHGGAAQGLVMQQDGNKTNLFGFGYGDGKQYHGVGSAQLAAGRWQHVAVVCDGKKAFFYVDDGEKANATVTGVFAHNPNLTFRLGQGFEQDGRFFRGLLSDVRIYERALSSTEVNTAMKEGKGTSRDASKTNP